jgi:xanthine dehydrogenase accessory factor
MSNKTSIYKLVSELELSGNAGALCTVIASKGSTPRRTGTKMLVYQDGNISGTVGGGELENRVRTVALQAISDGRPRTLSYLMSDIARGDPGVCGGQVDIYVEPILPAPMLVVVGGGHVGKAVSHLAKWLGFTVVVSDDRSEFCDSKINPDADRFLPVKMEEIPDHMTINRQTYFVLTTRGVTVDVKGLPALLHSPAAYIGVIGSRRRWATTVKQLRKTGVSKEAIARIHSPMGLELNAETPEEIAVSIMAEIIMTRNGGTGKRMKSIEKSTLQNQKG